VTRFLFGSAGAERQRAPAALIGASVRPLNFTVKPQRPCSPSLT
jgi:hypothetical protein